MMQRSLLIDSLKALASVLIVLHHLAFYGPMADHVRPLVPWVWGWLADDARMMVQVFLVIGGYLAARSLAPMGRLEVASLAPVLWNRFLRLALPYHVILLIAVAANEIARSLMTHASISAPASLDQLIAHALLLHDLLGYEALSAGLWYVAIDMQLFLLMAALLWLGRFADEAACRSHAHWHVNPSIVLVALLGLASLYHFNLDYTWDAWVFYFFGVYALGALAWWASNRARALPSWLAAMAACTAGALLVSFRERLLLALVVALLLALSTRWSRGLHSPASPEPDTPGALAGAIHRLGRISYSLFLVHFPVCLVINAAFTRFMPSTVAWQALGLGVAFTTSVAASAIFHRLVEEPLLHWVGRSAVRRPVLPEAP